MRNFGAGLYASLLGMEAICLALIVIEWRTGRMRWPIPFMLACYLLMHAIATPVALNPGFQAFCRWYAHLGS